MKFLSKTGQECQIRELKLQPIIIIIFIIISIISIINAELCFRKETNTWFKQWARVPGMHPLDPDRRVFSAKKRNKKREREPKLK